MRCKLPSPVIFWSFFTSGNGHSTSETRSFSRVINQIPVCFPKITAGRNSATTSSLTVKTVTLLHTDSLLWLSKGCPDKPAPFPRPQQVLYSLLSVVTLCTWMGVTEEKGERPCSFLLCWDLAPPLLPCHGKLVKEAWQGKSWFKRSRNIGKKKKSEQFTKMYCWEGEEWKEGTIAEDPCIFIACC